MAQVLDDSDFWLPRETAPLKINNADFNQHFVLFKSELSSPVAKSEEEDDIFADLNRRVAFSEARKVSPLCLRQPSEVRKVFGGSPQSILGGIGSWSGRSSNESHQSPLQGPSPSATPYEAEYDTDGLIYAAAGLVERLKISALKPSVNGQFRAVSITKSELNHLTPVQNDKAACFLAEQNYLAAARRAYNAALLYDHHLQNLNNSVRHSKSTTGQLTPSAWPSIQQHQPRVSNKASLQSAPLQRKESVGTGVFLPRRYNASPAAPPRKRAVTTSAIVPAKVVQALNMSFEEMSSRSQPHYSAYAASMSQKTYEVLMDRRNAFLAQQQRTVDRADNLAQSNIEMCLPQEWSY